MPSSPPPLPKSGSATFHAQRLIEADPERGTVRLEFTAPEAATNPAGFVQGGMLAAMLDDTMGPAIWTMTGGALLPVTIDMSVSYFRGVRPSRLIGEGRVVHMGKTIAFLEAQISSADGAVVARATSSVRLVPAEKGFGVEAA
ncbi:MAG: PaaI family thioesterase [Caulobacteraceae bacterium]